VRAAFWSLCLGSVVPRGSIVALCTSGLGYEDFFVHHFGLKKAGYRVHCLPPSASGITASEVQRYLGLTEAAALVYASAFAAACQQILHVPTFATPTLAACAGLEDDFQPDPSPRSSFCHTIDALTDLEVAEYDDRLLPMAVSGFLSTGWCAGCSVASYTFSSYVSATCEPGPAC
jgi:hypothetical protein